MYKLMRVLYRLRIISAKTWQDYYWKELEKGINKLINSK